jgi:hypothetical protein
MKAGELRRVQRVLGDAMGWRWPFLVLKCLARRRAILGSTQWARANSGEAAFVKRFSLASALYLEIADRMGEQQAFDAMRRILVPIGCDEQWTHMKSLRSTAGTPMGRLMAFHDLMDEKGAPRFNKREYVERSDHVCHFAITRCVFHDFFTQAGTPELTKLFCEVDREFFPAAFPEMEFHRGDSWENTIAYGKESCTFIFELREDRTAER